MIRPVFNDITLQPVFAFWIVEWARVRKMRLGQPAQVSSIELSTTGVFVLILLTFSLISIFVNPIYALSSTAISNQTWKVTDGGNPVNMAGFPKISTFTSDPSNRQLIRTSNLPEFQHTFASLGTADGQKKSLQLLVFAVPNATTKKPVRERTIVFPTNLSMGTLYIRSWKTTDSWSWQKVEEMSDGTMVPISVPSWISFDPTWRKLGIAQDTVVVPAGMELMLDVDRFASDNLSPLTHLGPNDLQHLDLSYLNRDTELVHLHKLTELKGIDFQEANLYDKGLTHLNNLKRLKELNLRRTYISDAGLAHLKGLTNLKVLDLRDTQISDAGLAHLAELTSLVSLSLPFLVTDKGLAHLMRLTELRELNLESAHISNVGLANLAELTSLEVLNLGSTRISNAGLHHLRNLINLKVLNLFGTRVNIDGTGLDHLKQLTSLEVLIFNPPGPLDPMEGIPRPATTDMPTGRFSLSTSVVSGKIYAIGGSNGDMTLPTVEVYNPKTGTWTQKTDMPTARHSLSTSVLDGKIYAIGGSSGDIVLPTVEVYNPETGTWTQKTDMPIARTVSTSVVNRKIYAIGGWGGGSMIHLRTEVYNPATDTWTRKANLLIPRSGLTTHTVGEKIYAIGGRVWGGSVLTVEEYDPVTDLWTRKPNFRILKSRYAACVINGKILLLGGARFQNNGEPILIRNIEIYDPMRGHN